MAAARVLLVDDEPVFLDAIYKALTKRGYDVLSAGAPRQALGIIKDRPPIDVVVSDVQMPELRGTDLIRQIGHLSPETACILMTGGAVDSADVPEGVQVLEKPVPTRDLISAVQEAVACVADQRAKLRVSRCRQKGAV